MRKIKVYDELEHQKALSNFQGFLEGRDKTVDEILRMNKQGMTPKQIIKYLKDYVKARHEDNSN